MRSARVVLVLVAVGLFVVACVSGADDEALVAETNTAASASRSSTPTLSQSDGQSPDTSAASAERLAASVDGVPVHVVATQGPIDESASYVLVTWDRAAYAATAHEIERNGVIVGRVEVDDDPWDDFAFRDEAVAPGSHRYRVRPITGTDIGAWSEPVTIEVAGSDDIGAVFEVDRYGGSDQQRLQAAIDDASDAGGGIVQLGARTYVLDDIVVVWGNGILIRGAGRDATTLKVGQPGGDESCGRVTPTLLFQSQLEPLGPTLAVAGSRGSSSLVFDGPAPVQVGDVVAIDGVLGQLPTWRYVEEGIMQDPTIPLDERYPFEAGTVVEVEGDRIRLDHPLSQDLRAGSALYRYDGGKDNGIELLTIEGLSEDDRSYHRLIDVRDQVRFRIADVTARWANRNFIDASGHHITLIGFEGIEGGAGGYELEACKYKVGFGPATDVTVVGSTFGSAEHDRNMSLLTMQFVYRSVIRHSTFGGSRTYGFNEHGGGSRDLVFENNRVSSGPASWAGILSGNDTWGFGGELAVRNNRFVDNVVDVLLVEHAYGVVVFGNHSTGCLDTCVTWSGWGGVHDGHRVIERQSDWGSAKLIVAQNRFEDAANGIRLGSEESSGFPYEGVRDAVIQGNVIEADGTAIRIHGDAALTGRIWIAQNELQGSVESEDPGPDWYVWGNTGGPNTGEAPLPSWMSVYQPWERG